MPAEPRPMPASRASGMARWALCCALALALPAIAPGEARAQAADYFKAVDLDGDGRLSLEEFLERMSWAFRQRDVNGNEVLDPEEQHVANARPISLAEHRARFTAQFQRQDTNRDGYLSPAEFLAPPR